MAALLRAGAAPAVAAARDGSPAAPASRLRRAGRALRRVAVAHARGVEQPAPAEPRSAADGEEGASRRQALLGARPRGVGPVRSTHCALTTGSCRRRRRRRRRGDRDKRVGQGRLLLIIAGIVLGPMRDATKGSEHAREALLLTIRHYLPPLQAC